MSWFEFNGKKDTISGWAKNLGIPAQNLRWRLYNWSIERALTERN